MKILHTADWHLICLHKKLGREKAVLRYIRFVREFLQIVDQHAPDIVVIGGDIYNNPNPNSWELILLSVILNELDKRDISVVLITGNHDIEGPASSNSLAYLLPFQNSSNFTLTTLSPRIQRVRGITFILWPPGTFPNKKQIAQAKAYPEPRIGVMHIPLYRSRITGDGRKLKTGFPLSLTEKTVEAFGLTHLLLGDIHEYQTFCKKTIIYSGAPLQTKSDESPDKGVVVIDLDKPKSKGVKFVPITTPPKLLTVSSIDEMNTTDYYRLIIEDKEEAIRIADDLPDNVIDFKYLFKQEIQEQVTSTNGTGWRVDLSPIIINILHEQGIKNTKKPMKYLAKLLGSKDSLIIP